MYLEEELYTFYSVFPVNPHTRSPWLIGLKYSKAKRLCNKADAKQGVLRDFCLKMAF